MCSDLCQAKTATAHATKWGRRVARDLREECCPVLDLAENLRFDGSLRSERPAQARLAKAEATYRRRLRKLAKIRARLAKQKRENVAAIILAFVIIGGVPDRLRAAACPRGTVVALLDATTAYDDIDRAQIMPAIEAMASSLDGGQRLLVRTVGASADDSLTLFDRCVPVRHSFKWKMSEVLHWLTSSPAALEEERRVFLLDLRDAMLPMLTSRADAKRSALRIPMKADSEFDRSRTPDSTEGGHRIRRSRTV